jgi:hypothetical protein
MNLRPSFVLICRLLEYEIIKGKNLKQDINVNAIVRPFNVVKCLLGSGIVEIR